MFKCSYYHSYYFYTEQGSYCSLFFFRNRNKSFKEIRFSYDLRGYPTELRIHVYTNKLLWHNHVKSFEIIYAQDSSNNPPYNIKDNPEKFEMKIIKN